MSNTMDSAVVKEGDLPTNVKNLWLKALSAFELRNFEYAISLLQSVIEQEPGFLDGRKALRKACIQKSKGKKGMFGGKISGGGFGGMKIQSIIKKDPVLAMVECEKALEKEPFNISANQGLYDAAMAAGMPEVGTFALETIREGSPDNTQNLHQLAEHLMKMDDPEEAGKVYDEIVRRDPADMDAVKGGKDASARASMAKQKYGDGDSFRDNLKEGEDGGEQRNKASMTNEQLEALLTDLSGQYEERSGELGYAREMGEICERLNKLDDAIQWYSYASDLSSGDPVLARKVEVLIERKDDLYVKGLEDNLAAATDPGERKELEEKLIGIKAERSVQLVDDARRRVEKNPTDKALRFELGQHLFNSAQYTEAIPELQQARTNPHIRTKAMLMLGQCFDRKSMHDMAANALSEAVSELTQMDDTKKELLYQLGLVYEKMDRKDESLNCFKDIYNSDYGYKDVAKRVEESYGDGENS